MGQITSDHYRLGFMDFYEREALELAMSKWPMEGVEVVSIGLALWLKCPPNEQAKFVAFFDGFQKGFCAARICLG